MDMFFIDLREKKGGGREEKRQCETNIIGYLPYTHSWGLNPQSRCVPWPGIELKTLWCTERCFNQLSQSYPAGVKRNIFISLYFSMSFHYMIEKFKHVSSFWIYWYPLVNKTMQVSSVQLHITSSAYCIMNSTPKIKPLSFPIYPFFAYLPPPSPSPCPQVWLSQYYCLCVI